jgi:RNA polymerase sigma factor (sigma-70 family)
MEPAANLHEAYERYLPLFFGVLGRLRRKGFRSDASVGMALIHDFFLDELPGLQERFDPERGQFDRYACVAFARFARRRIVADWKFGPLDEGGLSVSSAPEEQIDAQRLRELVDELPEADRHLLSRRFGDGIDLATMATELSSTAYRIKQRLAEALTRLAAVFGEHGSLSEVELRLARALYVDGCSISEAGVRLSMTEPQVRRMRRGILHAVAKGAEHGHW